MKFRSWLLSALFVIPCFVSAVENWEDYRFRVLRFQPSIPGWCKMEKAIQMMDLIHEVKPNLCVEIGVFGGSSIYPTAYALKYEKKGVVYAIDPWSKKASTVGYESNDPNYGWWAMLDYESIYRNFLKMLADYKLENYCITKRMDSAAALSLFADESIDILHIDGNHTEEVAYLDAVAYFPKVKKGGYIWFDDVNWSTTRKAVVFLSEHCDLDYERSIFSNSLECALFKKHD